MTIVDGRVTDAATLNLDSRNETIGSLSGDAKLELGSGTLATGGDDDSTNFSGAISGVGNLVKEGTGTFNLSGSNTFTGSTDVNADILQINGAIGATVAAGAVQVATGATLAGDGTVNAPVNVQGTLASRSSTAIRQTNDLALEVSSDFDVELNGTANGVGYDQVNVTGTITLNGRNLNAILGFTPNVGDVFTIVDNDDVDAVSGAPNIFNGLPDDATFRVGLVTFSISDAGDTGNDVVLTVTHVDDHGDNASSATVLTSLPSTLSGTISPNGDVDWFCFSMSEGTVVQIETRLNSRRDSVLKLFDLDGTTMRQFDDDRGAGLALFIEFIAPSNDRCYVEVRTFGSIQTSDFEIAFSLPPPSSDVHSNDAGAIGPGDDVDWFCFSVS